MTPPLDRPVVGVGAVVIHEGRVLLVRRGKDPLRGRWVVPGGAVEAGETLEQAVVREVREETGVTVRPEGVLLVCDRIQSEGGALQYHYVIIDYRCAYLRGSARADSDAQEVAWVAPSELAGYDLPEGVEDLVREAFTTAGDRALAEGPAKE